MLAKTIIDITKYFIIGEIKRVNQEHYTAQQSFEVHQSTRVLIESLSNCSLLYKFIVFIRSKLETY